MPKAKYPNLGERVRTRRLQLAMNQDEISKHLGVSVSAVRQWESGQRFPDAIATQRKVSAWLREEIPPDAVGADEIDGEVIRSERLRRGMSSGELATHLRVSRRSIYDWEKGKVRPQVAKLRILKRWLNEGAAT